MDLAEKLLKFWRKKRSNLGASIFCWRIRYARGWKSSPIGQHLLSSTVRESSKDFGQQIVVVVDVDEVLGNFVSVLNRFIVDRYSLKHSVSEYHVYDFFKIWNCSRDEADIRVHEFFKTSYFKTRIHSILGTQQALCKLSRFCNLSIVTSRQIAIKDHTIEWIEKHYPGLFQLATILLYMESLDQS